jgi:hypothetical protein
MSRRLSSPVDRTEASLFRSSCLRNFLSRSRSHRQVRNGSMRLSSTAIVWLDAAGPATYASFSSTTSFVIAARSGSDAIIFVPQFAHFGYRCAAGQSCRTWKERPSARPAFSARFRRCLKEAFRPHFRLSKHDRIVGGEITRTLSKPVVVGCDPKHHRPNCWIVSFFG